MALAVLTHAGPRAEQWLTFAGDRITFGREPSCDVSFPEEMYEIGHRHFEIVTEAGVYKFATNRHHRLFTGGTLWARELVDRDELTGLTEVRLGSRKGPRLLLDPRPQASGRIGTEPAGIAPTASQRVWRRTAGSLIALAILIGVAAAALVFFVLNGRDRSPGAANRYASSVLLIVDDGTAANADAPQAVATAFVVLLPDGSKALATNAHVAEDVSKMLAAGHRTVARLRYGKHDYRITQTWCHPARRPFQAEVARKYPDKMLLATLAYDVGWLIPDNQAGLSEPLPLAARATVERLDAGDPVTAVGYPSANADVFDLDHPNPPQATASIAAKVNFLLRGEREPRQFLEESVPSAQGASGSPIFGRSGDVIGIVSGGNEIAIRSGIHVPNAILVNFAERIDLLADLTGDGSVADFLRRKEAWRRACGR